jgi:hypothetical protein
MPLLPCPIDQGRYAIFFFSDMPIVFFHPNLNNLTSLPSVDLITPAGHVVHT